MKSSILMAGICFASIFSFNNLNAQYDYNGDVKIKGNLSLGDIDQNSQVSNDRKLTLYEKTGDVNLKMVANNSWTASYLGRFIVGNVNSNGQDFFTYLSNGATHKDGGDKNTFLVGNSSIEGRLITLSRDEGLRFMVGDATTNGQEVTFTEAMSVAPTGEMALNFAQGSTGVGLSLNTGSEMVFRVKRDGHVSATEIHVSAPSLFPDYVFEKDYDLMPLSNLKTYIQTNKHLPNIPSAKEIQEQGSMPVGDLLVKQMEKIEELTLYIIDQNERIKKLEEELSKLK